MNGLAAHEATHVVLARHYGWPTLEVIVSSCKGKTLTWPRTDGDLRQRALEAAVVTIGPFVRDPTTGASKDQERVRVIVDEVRPSGKFSLVTVWDTAEVLLRDSAIDRDIERLAVVLRERPHLYTYEIDRILA